MRRDKTHPILCAWIDPMITHLQPPSDIANGFKLIHDGKSISSAVQLKERGVLKCRLTLKPSRER